MDKAELIEIEKFVTSFVLVHDKSPTDEQVLEHLEAVKLASFGWEEIE